MDSVKYHHIAHADHVVINPISLPKVDELLDLLQLPQPARVLDIGCGKAEMLVRIAARRHIAGVGVERSALYAAEAAQNVRQRVRAPSAVDILVMDGGTYEDSVPFDLAMCVGASWVFGGHRGTLRRLSRFVLPGGLVVVGEPYWRQEPEPAYLAAMGVKAEDFLTNAGNVEAGVDEGLVPLYSVAGSEADWDRYEWLRVQATERYCWANPGDPDVPEMLKLARQARDAHLRWGRQTIGWAMYMFLKP